MRTTRPAEPPMAGSWVTSTIVWPSWRFSSCSRATTWSAMAVSRLPVGSSAQTTAGRAARALAMVTRCCSPPDSSLGRWPVRWPSPTRSSIRTAAARARLATFDEPRYLHQARARDGGYVDDLPESKQVRLDRLYPGAIWKQPERTLLVPLPPEGTSLPTWLCELLTGVLGAPDAPTLPDSDRPEPRRAAS